MKNFLSDDLVVVALGSNLPGQYPSCRALLEACLARFPGLGLKVLASSRWWRSSAWPDASDPDYLNGVAIVETDLGPAAVMDVLLRLEAVFGRRRDAANGPRTLDLDLVAHGRMIVQAGGLTLPHPRAHERRFVMGPLAEIAPAWIHPVFGQTAAQLAGSAGVGRDAAPLAPD